MLLARLFRVSLPCFPCCSWMSPLRRCVGKQLACFSGVAAPRHRVDRRVGVEAARATQSSENEGLQGEVWISHSRNLS